ncbi:dc4a75fa-256f-481d-b30a-852f5b3d22cc [Sclerotinia trifoliorum]|uniref:Dc4a75fa-256f-481d-b30a-852f5b3d22cc n=1 Tax=Sclerotinia trifoliorum TaxID=28548 RepID=A0A8H2ZTH0_9HELO|nr:dc4a75fa-256f-481d-b30a-852f5b3d22cc [Sclerotinia trifoliorum]
MPDPFSTGWTFTRPIPQKRLFADFEECDPSLQRPGATKRLRAEKEEAEQEVKTIQQQPKPLPPKHSRALFLEDTVNLLPSSFAPIYCPESVKSSVTQWVKSVSGSGSELYRERHCRSDTLLGHSNCDIIPRRFTKSASNMEYRRDSEGFALPSAPASAKSFLNNANLANGSLPLGYGPSAVPSHSGISSTSGRKNLISSPQYRIHNLLENNIFIRSFYEEFPPDIAELVDLVSKDCDSPHLPSGQIKHNTHLEMLEMLEMGASEPDVEEYFRTYVFPVPAPTDGLQRTVRNPMARHAVPCSESIARVSTPVPDMLYGYKKFESFPRQQTQLSFFGDGIIANSQNLMFPFFIVEFKCDGPSGCGSMWMATNQCVGGSASCVNIAERLSRQRGGKVRVSDSAAFSIAMNGTEARLFITWKHDELKYYMRKVRSFLLQDPEHYAQFLKYVLKIIDWGMGERLKGTQKSLDAFLEEERKIASQQAKARPPPPSDEPTSSSRQKSKASPFPGPNGQVNTGQVDGIGGLTGPYWTLAAASNRYFHVDENGNITWRDDEDESSSAQ